MDDLDGHVLRPGRGYGCVEVRLENHVGLGPGFLGIIIRIFAGDGLVKNRYRQEGAFEINEFACRHDLAAGNACKVANDAFDLFDNATIQPDAG